MNTDSGDHEHPHEPARAGTGEGMRSCWFVATDDCPVSFFPFGRQAVSVPLDRFPAEIPRGISRFIGYQSRPKPRGGMIAWSSVRSSSAMARRASAVAVAVSRNPSGKASYQAVNSACRVSNSATVSSQRCGRERRPAADSGRGRQGSRDRLCGARGSGPGVRRC